MPYETKIKNDGIIARYFGVVTFDEVRESSSVTWGHPIWDTAKYYITDFLDADKLEMSPDQAMVGTHGYFVNKAREKYKEICICCDQSTNH